MPDYEAQARVLPSDPRVVTLAVDLLETKGFPISVSQFLEWKEFHEHIRDLAQRIDVRKGPKYSLGLLRCSQ